MFVSFQRFLSARDKEAEEKAMMEKQRHLEEILRQKRESEARAQAEAINDQEMVERMFEFLPETVGGQEGQAPVGYEVQEPKVLLMLS